MLVLAQTEAGKLQHSFIGTEHILYGLAAEEGPPGDRGVAGQVLASIDVTPEKIEAKILEVIGMAPTDIKGPPPFTPRAKKVLELALREALQLGHSYVGTEHLLLGMIREGEGVGAVILKSLGHDFVDLRQAVIRAMGGTVTQFSGPENMIVVDHQGQKPVEGIWMVWEYSMPSYPFATEIEALRFAQEQNVQYPSSTVYVEFVKWGERPG